MSDPVVNYSATDRFLHRFALRNAWLQRTMADIEDRLFSRSSTTEAGGPVFITALPRSGTTLLLNICAASGRFATHTYRDMPFVLAPLLWNRISGPFRQRGTRRERAHGDGVDVDFDSAEAFEEVLWLAFWQHHFTGERIRLWEADEVDEDGEFPEFFRRHMGKLIALRSADDPAGAVKRRYLSKNNANIARLGWLRRSFPDCRIVIPFRRPDTHIRSLMTQHERFSHLHRDDPFARDYMSLIGHFEFGAALRPIGFDGVPATPEAPDAPGAQEFWARYWVAAYRHILATADDTVIFLPYESLCETPGELLPRLAAALDLPPSAFDASVAGIRPLPERPGTGLDLPVSLREETENLHRLLVERSKRCLFAESVEQLVDRATKFPEQSSPSLPASCARRFFVFDPLPRKDKS